MKPDTGAEVLVKEEAQTDLRYGCVPENRLIKEYINNGIINIDKPAGPSSHQVSAWVRDILELEKAGHSGTLDPKVTGVLPVALGDATKIVKILLLSEKEYVCLMSLHDKASDEEIKKTVQNFQGEIFQTPPVTSAVKRELRVRSIYEIRIIERHDKDILYKVRCEAGTYIRKLCHDIGLVLGTGAHMHELRRTKTGSFDETCLVTMQDLKDAYEFYKRDGDEKHLRAIIQPVEAGVKKIKKIWVKDSAVDALCHGANLNAPGISRIQKDVQKNDPVAIMSLKNELVALGKARESTEQMLSMQKGTAAELQRVIMQPNTYPKQWRKQKI